MAGDRPSATTTAKCHFRPVAAGRAAQQQQPLFSDSISLLDDVMGSGGKGAVRTLGENQGKKLLVGEVRLDGYPRGWTFKVCVDGERLPPKRAPKWTMWLELPLGRNITLEVLYVR